MVATKIILHEAHNFDCIEIDSRDVHEIYTEMIMEKRQDRAWLEKRARNIKRSAN